MIKFYNGRKLVLTVNTTNSAMVLNNMIQTSTFCGVYYEWTRYKIKQ